MDTLGRHVVAELSQCDSDILGSVECVRRALESGAIAAGATILNGYCHQFSPTGVSGVLCLAESHISVHTWPEQLYAAADIFTCGKADPSNAIDVLKRLFRAQSVRTLCLVRGIERGHAFDLRIETPHVLKIRSQHVASPNLSL